MEHFMVNIQFLKNGEITHTITKYESKEQAVSAYHATLLYNYGADEIEKFMVMVMNDSLPLIWESHQKEIPVAFDEPME